MNRIAVLLLCTCLAVCLTAPLLAQNPGRDITTPASLSHFRFSFINPGARASAMGGAFIAQGNDATGSETNPAGLLFIPRPMLFAEYRHYRYRSDREYTATADQVINRVFVDQVDSPAFLSYVHPGRNWAFAIYRQELANFRAGYERDSFLLPDPPPGGDILWVMNRQPLNLDCRLTNYGLSLARRLTPEFSLGASVRLAHLSFEADERADYNRPPPQISLSRVSAPPDGIGQILSMDDDSWRVSYVVGLQYKPNDWLSLGMVYRYGERHRLKAVFSDNISILDPAQGWVSQRKVYDRFEIAVPDRIGAGISLTPTDRLTVNADYVRVTYSDLNAQFRRVLQDTHTDSTDPSSLFGWKNGDELRAGLEYTIPLGVTDSISLRGGYYRAPDPSIHYRGGGDPAQDRLYRLSFPALGAAHHATFGLGAVLRRNLQIDLAADLGRDRNNFSVSLMYNFGR